MRKYYYRDKKCMWLYESVIQEMDFTSRWPLTTNTEVTNSVRQQILELEKNNDGSHLVVYQKSDDPTQIITTDMDGSYYVVDHSKYNPQTGEHITGRNLRLSDAPNIGFFSTVVSLYLDALSDGTPIKVSAVSDKMWKSYNRVLEKVAEQNTNYHLGDVTREYNHKYDITVYSRTVIPKSKSGLDYRNKIIESLNRMNKVIS